MNPFLTCVFQEKPKISQVFFLENFSRCQALKELVFVANTYSKSIVEKHLHLLPEAKLIVIPDGEMHKNQKTKQWIEQELFVSKATKELTIVGVGGGVVSDLVGYIASTYLRGVNLVLVPTTFLAMVDAAFGGKTGVNTEFGKNLVGTIYPASEIWIDITASKTWSLKHLQEGFSEIIKKALISDKNFFVFLEQNVDLILKKDLGLLKECIKKSLEIKSLMTKNDIFDQHKRRCLNFGHTIAHALEYCSHYTISHGHAVAVGLCVETWISGQFFPQVLPLISRIFKLLEKLHYNLTIPLNVTLESMLSTCLMDKKNTRTQLRVVLIKDLGEVEPFANTYCKEVPYYILEKSLLWMFETFSGVNYVIH
jgi:3-dehydroquinate synthase